MAVNSATTLENGNTAQLPPVSRLSATLTDYWALTKPEVNLLIVIATGASFYQASSIDLHPFPLQRLIHTLLGTLIMASGAGTLNQYVERKFDARMRRTARRPLAAGRLHAVAALRFGVLLSIAGAAYLFVAVNALASLLAVLTLTSYLFLYTPLKRRTPLCTLVGAVPGAMPPLIGWAAASGSISSKAWILYAALFLWQFPHFMSIAWMYREDYARAGYLILPNNGREQKVMAWLTAAPSIALLLVSLIAVATDSDHIFRSLATLILGSALLYCGARLVLLRSRIAARQLLRASIVYLPLEFLTLVLGRH
jgi:protoheme IX farnesyltransferase